MRHAVKQFLRSPKVIVGELLGLALACSLGAALPQAGTATPAECARLQEAGPLVATLVRLLALDHIFRSGWFLAVTAFAAGSLALLTVEQWKRLPGQWSLRLSEAHFSNAPFRAEFDRCLAQANRLRPSAAVGPRLQIWTEQRVGLLGSPLLHQGILLLIAAGALRALFSTEAMVDLVEGETLPATTAAWPGQWPGVLGRAFQLEFPLTLDAVKATHYADGDLRELRVWLSLQSGGGTRPAQLAVNRDLQTGRGRVYLGSDFGPAALLEWQGAGIPTRREAVLLAESARATFEGVSTGPDGLQAYLRARVDAGGAPPQSVEVRVMREGALLFTGDVGPGQTVSLRGGGQRLVLHGTPFWVRLRGSHDPALGLAYLGFVLVLAGTVLLFAAVKTDICVQVTPQGQRERVFVALKPQRFAPLFQERFERLVREVAAGAGEAPGEAHRPEATPEPAGRLASTAGARMGLLFLPLLLAFSLTGCNPPPGQQARQLVERYNALVSEAYRRGDANLLEPVVGLNEGKKLTGLIGVRLDLGLTLDAQLLALEITGVEQAKEELRVATKERWRYRDRKIGTGEQVGEESLDAYEMLYVFKRTGQTWLVEEIRFTAPPQVGRKSMTWLASREPRHGRTENTKPTGVQSP